MFKKLRNKILIMSMLLTSLIIVVALGAIYWTAQNNIQAKDSQTLAQLIRVFGDNYKEGSKTPVKLGKLLRSSGFPTRDRLIHNGKAAVRELIPAFVLTVDQGRNILMIHTEEDADTFPETKAVIDKPYSFYKQAALDSWHVEAWQDSSAGQRPGWWPFTDVNKIKLDGRWWTWVRMGGTWSAPGVAAAGEGPDYHIAFLDITASQETLHQLLTTLTFAGIGILVFVFLLVWFFTSRSIKPIVEAWKKQKQFVADASHELKTPLATIMTNYDVLLSNPGETVQSQKQWLGYMKIGMDRMNKLISNLLLLARLENKQTKDEKQSFHISSLVTDNIQLMNMAAREKGLDIITNIPTDMQIYGHKGMVEQVFIILYDNAIKYADQGGTVNVTLSQIKKQIQCSVKNTGQGIPPKDLRYIFDRFYKADFARNSEDGSYGLGLPIAQAIAEQLNGKITVQSVENEWTEFVFSFD